MRSATINYFVHGTTIENEKGIAAGWSPGELSTLGRRQCFELRELIGNKGFDVVFCSDSRRAIDSATIIFGDHARMIQDKRLREVNLGDLTGADSNKIDSIMLEHVGKSFPKGESFKDVEKRIASFLKDLPKKHPRKSVAIVAHRAPQLALEVLINRKSWEQAIKEDWRPKQPKEWKPGWKYEARYLTS